MKRPLAGSLSIQRLAPLILALLLPGSLRGNDATPTGASRPTTRVRESARGIPVAYRIDVVVVGGSTAAVAAATAAASQGARVFLAAPYPYLGEDMTATLRLWLEEGEMPESPLARKLFSERPTTSTMADPARLVPFTYEASLPSAAPHRDSSPPSLLNDNQWGSATDQSVQYDGDVDITLRLADAENLQAAHVLVYHTRDFQVDSVSAATSADGSRWTPAATASVRSEPQGSVTEPALQVTLPLKGPARHVKLSVKKTAASTRVLVGEIAVVRAGDASVTPRKEVIPPARPLHVKKTLDRELLDAGVEFLYASYVTDLLIDADGQPAGVVIANRAGRQAVVAKVIIDATGRSTAAVLAGAKFRPAPGGPREVRFVVVGRRAREEEGLSARIIPPPFQRSGQRYSVIEYTLDVPMPDASLASRMRAEQLVRDATYRPDQQFTGDVLFEIPPERIEGRASSRGAWRGVAAIDLAVLRPAGVNRLYVLGGRADVSREQAEMLLRPLASIDLGTRVGLAAAREALALSEPRGVRVQVGSGGTDLDTQRDVRESLVGVRPVQKLSTVPQDARELPVLAEYDVVVIGGGTSGAPTGIGAARQGARTLVVEYLHGLGGVGTFGAISSYYWGNRVGFSATVGNGGGRWIIEQKAEWWRQALQGEGADIWFGTMGCGAVVEGDRVVGAVVATPGGRGVVMAKVVVDATGNADIAAAAGARCLYTDATDIAMQGTGLPPRRLGTSYTNTDFTIVDETDMMDIWRVFVGAKYKAGDAFDIGRLIDTRERRRIVGEFTISILDQMLERTYPDTVTLCHSDFDTHGYTTDPYFTLEHPPRKKGIYVRIPYRALLPQGLRGILVTGLGLSAHRDAVPLIRMQADMQNLGYAVGVAAATVAAQDKLPRELDVRALQKHLVEIQNLPESILTEDDSFPLPAERVAGAVETAGENYEGVAVILANRERALPLLREAHADAKTEEEKLRYAHILAVLGDSSGVEELIAAVEAFQGLDRGWRYTGMGQFGPNMSPLDRFIYALGRTRDRRAVGPIVEKAKLLEAEHEFSHFRAVTLALESIGDPRAAEVLAEVLSKPGVRGHAAPGIEGTIEQMKKYPSWNATEPRSHSIRELLLGRALFRCGDRDGLGRKVLEEYRDDLRGHLSRHADEVLEEIEDLD